LRFTFKELLDALRGLLVLLEPRRDVQEEPSVDIARECPE
jgi:hypothetical protein